MEAATGFAPRVPTLFPGDEPLTLVIVEGFAASDTSRNQSVLHYASPAAGNGLPARQITIAQGRSAGFVRDDCESSDVETSAIPITKCETPSGRADIYRFEVGDHVYVWTVIPGAEFATEEMVEVILEFAAQ